MKKTTIMGFVMAAVAAIFLGGCSMLSAYTKAPASQQPAMAMQFALDGTQVAMSLKQFEPELTQVSAIVTAHKSDFSAADWQELVYTYGKLQTMAGLVESLGHGSGVGTASKVVNLDQIKTMHSVVKAAYLSAKQIIEAHKASFTPLEVLKMNQLDADAAALETAYQAILSAPPGTNVTPMITQAIQLAGLVAQVAIAYK